MYWLFAFTSILVLSFPTYSQEIQEQRIISTIETFFNGMREGDSSKIANTVTIDCTLKSVTADDEGNTQIQMEEIEWFIGEVTQDRGSDVYDERLLSYDVKIDDRMAFVWSPYRFYINDQFIHCGVNMFSLVLLKNEWKIIGIMDTRRKVTCEEE